jgi:hypothetical protein
MILLILTLFIQPALATTSNSTLELRHLETFGYRCTQWLKSATPSDNQSSLDTWDPKTAVRITAEVPLNLSLRAIMDAHRVLISRMPDSMYAVLLGGGPMPSMRPSDVSEEVFGNSLIQCSQNYAKVTRYLFLNANQTSYKILRNDFRDWLKISNNLNQIRDLAKKIGVVEKREVGQLFLQALEACAVGVEVDQICSDEFDVVAKAWRKSLEFDGAVDASLELGAWVDRIEARGKSAFANRFKILKPSEFLLPSMNQDGVKHLVVPFKFMKSESPVDEKKFFRLIQEALAKWSQKGVFEVEGRLVEQSAKAVEIRFQVGAQIRAGGDHEYMEFNPAFMMESTLQKTILAHELGHILGFPDCYVEFWDGSLESYTQYGLDVENLMCSLTGSIQESHFVEMTRVYFANH